MKIFESRTGYEASQRKPGGFFIWAHASPLAKENIQKNINRGSGNGGLGIINKILKTPVLFYLKIVTHDPMDTSAVLPQTVL